MDDSVKNMEADVQDVQEAQNGITEGPGLQEPAAGQEPEAMPDSPAKQMNPALKYGRRMDYKTAKVNDKQIKDLKLSLATPNNVQHPAPSSSSNGQHHAMSLPDSNQDEPKSALELELEALEAKAAAPQPIHNPLPTPKKRVPKEMEFDIEPSEYEMHFDLVDLHGRDYFDIN